MNAFSRGRFAILSVYPHSRYLAGLLRAHLADPRQPFVGAEVGVYRGETSAYLLREFPGLTLYGIDARSTADFGSDYDLSGAATNAVYANLGRQHAYDYCFASGTLVLMADGSRKPIEQIQPGDLVLAASDQDPEIDF